MSEYNSLCPLNFYNLEMWAENKVCSLSLALGVSIMIFRYQCCKIYTLCTKLISLFFLKSNDFFVYLVFLFSKIVIYFIIYQIRKK